MTSLRRAHVLKREHVGSAEPRRQGDPTPTSTEIPRGRLLRRVEHEASQRADAIVRAARDEASAIVAQARDAADELRQRAIADAHADAKKRYAAALDAIEVGLTVEQRREHLVALARLLAEQLIVDELRLRPEAIVGRARNLLQRAAGARHVVLVCHPDHVDALREVASSDGGAPGVRPDASLAPGDIRIDTDVGRVEAHVRSELRKLASALVEGES